MRGDRYLPLALVTALLAATMLSAVFANPSIPAIPDDLSEVTLPPPVPQTYTTEPQPSGSEMGYGSLNVTVPQWVTWVITALCVLAFVVMALLVAWMVLRGRLRSRPEHVTQLTVAPLSYAERQLRVRHAVEEGLADLDDHDLDPRRAVIACWVRLEEAAAAAGTPREPGDTSTDLVERLLREHRVDAGLLAGLAELYRLARFGTHLVDVNMRDRARTALRQLRDQFAVEVG